MAWNESGHRTLESLSLVWRIALSRQLIDEGRDDLHSSSVALLGSARGHGVATVRDAVAQSRVLRACHERVALEHGQGLLPGLGRTLTFEQSCVGATSSRYGR